MTISEIIPCLLLAGAFSIISIHADDMSANSGSGDQALELKPDLVVTPSRRLEAIGDTLASVSVITREDIEISVAQDLFELLRLEPGVDVVRSGGPGAQVSVFLRGSNSNHVLVLVDGVRVSSANSGAYAWEQLPLNQVERVEIVRGPHASLYGSDAIGGVIQVLTRGNADPYTRVTTGSYGTSEVEGGFGFRGENSELSINAGYRKIDGFSAQNPDGFNYHPDDDGFEAANIGVKGSTHIDAGTWKYSLLAIDSETEFDQGVSDTRQWLTSVSFEGRIRQDWNYKLLGGYVNDRLDSDFIFFATGFRSNRLDLTWQNQLDISGGVLSFGLDYFRESGESRDTYDETRNNAGLFASLDRDFSHTQLQIGARLDENSEWGSEFTGHLAGGVELGQSWQLRASLGSAFRGPNLNEQFSPGFGGFFAGNPDLRPESSATAEIGLDWVQDRGGSFSAALYRTDIDDLISCTGANFQAVNIEQARPEGLELEYSFARDGWLLRANLTLQDSKDKRSGEALLRRPEEKGTVSLDRKYANGSWLGLEFFASGKRPDIGGITLDSYYLLNFRGGWAITDTLRTELRADNLLDEDYEPAFGFNSPDRSFFLSLAWMP
jgi:vitamin B12 transporter